VRLSSGIPANILDFGIPQKHVLNDMTATEARCKTGDDETLGCEVQTYRAGRPDEAPATEIAGPGSGAQGGKPRAGS